VLLTPEHLGALYLLPCPTRGHGVWTRPLSDRVEYRDADGQPRYREPSGRELAARKPGDPVPGCGRRP
jgi:hypothetical protein